MRSRLPNVKIHPCITSLSTPVLSSRMAHPLRLVVFDATQQAGPPALLGASWRAGSRLYRSLGRVDASYGARSFADMFAWLADFGGERSIGELQFWGHGKWGRILIGSEALDRQSLCSTHPHRSDWLRLRERLAPDALLWFRTCETLGALAGQRFAAELADFTGARVAGHTYVIGFFQSGLRCLSPGARPHWSVWEGLSSGSPEAPLRALASRPGAPSTITCLRARLPQGC